MAKKWTPKEDAAILKAVNSNPDDVREALTKLGSKWNWRRSLAALVTRYYNTLQKQNHNEQSHDRMA